ncbi:MAG: hypothetical protein JWN60_1836 [Acidobacteria bacterium]|nr:hypothetical protein [Acidobacteriota bacterium]
MRSKTILSIAAFTVAFILSTAFAGLFITKSDSLSDLVAAPAYNSKRTSCFKKRGTAFVAEKIETIVKQDKMNGNKRAQRLYQIDEEFRPSFSSPSFPLYADAVSEYVTESENLSYRTAPRDFQAAWVKHMKAWRDYSNFLEKMKSSQTRANLSETDASKIESSYSDDINDTWYEVLRVGRSHGAEIY